MARMIEWLYDSFYRRPKQMEEERQLCSSEALLKRDFSKWHKKILLRIIDDKNLICEKVSLDSFEKGLHLGLMLATEVFELKGVPSNEYSDGTPLH